MHGMILTERHKTPEPAAWRLGMRTAERHRCGDSARSILARSVGSDSPISPHDRPRPGGGPRVSVYEWARSRACIRRTDLELFSVHHASRLCPGKPEAQAEPRRDGESCRPPGEFRDPIGIIWLCGRGVAFVTNNFFARTHRFVKMNVASNRRRIGRKNPTS